MIRKALALCGVLVLTACSPELIPIPITPASPQVLSSPTASSLSAPIVNEPNLVTIHMVDQKNGWGINDAAVLRTIDGGSTWHDVTPSGERAFGYAVNSDFLDVRHGWVLVPDANNMLAGSLYQTSDGGMNWAKSSVPFGGGDLRFLDVKQGWMMASLGAGAGSMGVGVFQTTDGGSTWSQKYTNDPNQPGAGNSLPLGGMKDGIAATDMKDAWIGGITYTPGVLYLYETHDGGRTWSQSPVKTPTGYEQAELETTGPVFANPTLAYLPVHLSSQNGVMLAVYISRDGGASWLLTPTLIPMGASIDVVSETVAVAWNGTDFYVTTDGAQTWTTTAPDIRFSDSFSGLDFISALVGYVLTNNGAGVSGLYMTSDGGATWNLLSR